ncbi:MAG: ABC transporter ATP-binding protein, partial [Gemmatimonadales bacterium]|nr:ABC transporter ATP-binding protein [Gemmatimonadales bacterium]
MTVELAHVSKWYGNIVAVNDVSFMLTPGITGLLGPNGAGKSTILHMLVGLLRPSSGTVTVNGVPSWQHPEIYRTLGFVPESESVYSFLTGYELVRLNARLQQLPDADAAVKRAIDLVEMTAAQGRPVATYSKGMRQRIKIAAMLVHSPTVLLLDEPFNGMDPKQRLQMMAVLRRLADAGST